MAINPWVEGDKVFFTGIEIEIVNAPGMESLPGGIRVELAMDDPDLFHFGPRQRWMGNVVPAGDKLGQEDHHQSKK